MIFMKKIAIIGGGIVGSCAAFYLSKAGMDVVLYDVDKGQASKAAVGIICPWVSQRRNKDWYDLVEAGASFYHQLIQDLSCDSFYERTGALLTHPTRLEKMLILAQSRKDSAKIMGEIKIINEEENPTILPVGLNWKQGLYLEGAARVDGKALVEILQRKSVSQGLKIIKKSVSFKQEKDAYIVNGDTYTDIILSTGAWLPELFKDKGYSVDVLPQKGQLIEFNNILKSQSKAYPLFIPKGEIDLLFGKDGSLVVGASHEPGNYEDTDSDKTILQALKSQASEFYPLLKNLDYSSSRVGLRAYTKDFLPFYGELPFMTSVYVASGLGSSGLTSGPIIAYRLSRAITGEIDLSLYPLKPDNYFTKE